MHSVFLVGFPATGKTTVGRALAIQLGVPFVDLDDEVARRVGRDVPTIIREDGEAAFRTEETAALRDVAQRDACVIATGGGAVTITENRNLMRHKGLVVGLHAPLEVLLDRADKSGDRPLLGDPAQARALFDERLPLYRQAHAVVDVSQRSADQVASFLARRLGTLLTMPSEALAESAAVVLEDDAYPVLVAPGAVGESARWLEELFDQPPTHVAVVTDSNVGSLYAKRFVDGLPWPVSVHTLPAGETTKSMAQLESLLGELCERGLDRASVICALGGGVVGDIAGFAAASLFRGIRCVQVPTTLLAMVDSAIGGKTGVNLSAGKNLVGAFWQPEGVLVDPSVLATLPHRERQAAFGEVMKYGLLDGAELWGQISDLAADFADPREPWTPPEGLGAVVRRCAAWKAWVVSLDERERFGLRALLNLGHTVGHAIEKAAGYGTLLHGEAVALGLLATCRLSQRLGLSEATLEQEVAGVMTRAGMQADVDSWLRDDVLTHVRVDKKSAGGKVGFICLRDMGRPEIRPLPAAEIARVLRRH